VDYLPLDSVTSGLAALPNLSSLSLDSMQEIESDDCQTALSATCGGLTRLVLSGYLGHAYSALQAPLVADKLHNLRVIVMDEGIALDGLWLDVLLALPSLTHITTSNIDLSESHAHRHCAWQEIHMRGVIFIRELGYLALKGLRRLVLGGDVLLGAADEDVNLQQVEAALTNIPASCQLSVPSSGVLTLGCPYRQEVNKSVPLLLPLLHRVEGVRTLRLHSWDSRLLPSTASAIGTHLARVPTCTSLHFEDWKPQTSTQLLTALAPTNVTHLILGVSKVVEMEVAVWCSGLVERDMVVEVRSRCRVDAESMLACVREMLPRPADSPTGARITLLLGD
jgi:hypothetical protein